MNQEENASSQKFLQHYKRKSIERAQLVGDGSRISILTRIDYSSKSEKPITKEKLCQYLGLNRKDSNKVISNVSKAKDKLKRRSLRVRYLEIVKKTQDKMVSSPDPPEPSPQKILDCQVNLQKIIESKAEPEKQEIEPKKFTGIERIDYCKKTPKQNNNIQLDPPKQVSKFSLQYEKKILGEETQSKIMERSILLRKNIDEVKEVPSKIQKPNVPQIKPLEKQKVPESPIQPKNIKLEIMKYPHHTPGPSKLMLILQKPRPLNVVIAQKPVQRVLAPPLNNLPRGQAQYQQTQKIQGIVKPNLKRPSTPNKIVTKQECKVIAQVKSNNSRLSSLRSEETNIQELKLQEKKIQEEKLQEKKIQEEKLQEKKIHEQKLQEKKIQEQKLQEKKIQEQKLQEKKIQDQRLLEKKIQEQKLQEKKIQEQKLQEKKIQEQAEQELILQTAAIQRQAKEPPANINKINIIFKLDPDKRRLKFNQLRARKKDSPATVKSPQKHMKTQTEPLLLFTEPEKKAEKSMKTDKFDVMTNCSTNSFLNQEMVHKVFFEQDILVVVQKQFVSYYRYDKMKFLLTGVTNFNLIDKLERKLYDEEVNVENNERLCFSETCSQNPILIEMRGKQKVMEPNMCPLLSLYCNIYYLDQDRLLFSCVHLDTVKSLLKDICYITIPNTCYFLMSWCEPGLEKPPSTGLCKYNLTPNLQLAKLASIRQFPTIHYIVKHLNIANSFKLVVLGETELSIFNYNTGDLLSSLDLGRNYGLNLTTFEISPNYLFMVKIANTDSDKEKDIHVAFIGGHSPSLKIIHSQRVQMGNFTAVTSTTSSQNQLICTFDSGTALRLNLDNFNDINIKPSNDRIFACSNNTLVVLKERNVQLLNSQFYIDGVN